MPKVTTKTNRPSEVDPRLICLCRNPDDLLKEKIACSFCSELYHLECLQADGCDPLEPDVWICPPCTEILEENPALSTNGVLRLQGRVAPKTGWSNSILLKDVPDQIIEKHSLSSRHRREGYILFREGKVGDAESCRHGTLCFYRFKCEASMRNKIYEVTVSLKDSNPPKLKWIRCSCAAGVEGGCKHGIACLYSIIDLSLCGKDKIPDTVSCTSKLQMWHSRKPTSDQPLLLNDIPFVKHDIANKEKRELGCASRYHNPLPSEHQSISPDEIQKLVTLFETHASLPILGTLKSNNFEPALPKTSGVVSELSMGEKLFLKVASTPYPAIVVQLEDEDVGKFYDNFIKVDLIASKGVEKKTRLQSKNSYWFEQRSVRITASICKTFCNLRPTTDPVTTFLSKRKFFTAPPVRHGIKYEDTARAQFILRYGVSHCAVGLVINPAFPFLAVSPDMLIERDGELELVEIKCPYNLFKQKNGIKQKASEKDWYLKLDQSKQLIVNTDHACYYQMQLQMLVTNVHTCNLLLFVPPKDMEVVKVSFEEDFANTILHKLTIVYFQNLLHYFHKEIVG